MKPTLRVLIVEDSEFDARMMVHSLRQGGYEVVFERVETAEAMQTSLRTQQWDCILSDYNLPSFSAPEALKVLQNSGLDLPFIVVSGGIGEDIAVAAMKAGAHDYLMKGNLNRLAPAVERELREAAVRAEERRTKQALRQSEMRYRLLWETSPDAVILIDTDSNIRFVNPAVREVFGYAPEEVIGQPLTILQPPQLRQRHLEALRHYLATSFRRRRWRAMETLGRRKDGVEIPVEISFADMELDGQRHFVGFIRDVTERKMAERELRENQEQFRVARDIQQHLFPKAAPSLPGFEIAGASYPAEFASGDYYDYLPMLSSRLGIVVADVAGHGIGPALLMAETRAYLRLLAMRRESAAEILALANRVLVEDVDAERFITLVLARIDPEKRALIYASAGHPTGYLLNEAGEIKSTLPRTGLPLGRSAAAEYTDSAEIQLESGDLLLLFSDGIEETISADQKSLFGKERLLQTVREQRQKPARLIVDALYQATRSFAGNAAQEDDITAIVVKVAAGT